MASRILIVEDERDIASFLRLELKHEGYEVDVACNGREALELLTSLPVMLVIEVLLCLVFSVVLGWWMSKQALRPVRAISAQIAAKTADNHNLFERIDENSVDKEFQVLVRAFNQVMQQLEVSFARQRQFVSDASHELRTPIAVLQGHIQMLDRWGKSDPEVLDESLGVLKREIAELKDMVHRLLLLDKAEQGRIEVKHEAFDVAEALEKAKADILLISPKSNVTVSVEKGTTFVGDSTIVQQVLRILLDNSVRYCPPPGHIRLIARVDEEGLHAEVSDEGKYTRMEFFMPSGNENTEKQGEKTQNTKK